MFPRPLPQAPETRVVGINYQLIDEPVIPKALRVEPTATVLPKQKPPATLVKPLEPKPTPPKPAIRRFKVTVRRSATVENEIHVTATNQAAAEREAIEKVKGKPLRVLGTEVRLEVVQTV